MQLLENNRKTHKALQQQQKLKLLQPVAGRKQKKKSKDTEDGMMVEEADKMDDDNNSNERSIKELLEEILGKEPWAGQRASKMDLDDFLQLLSEFNDAGVHFC